MEGKLTLSVVDQSPIRKGGTPADALHETIELAVAAEKLGYKRYWVAEHHNAGNFAGTSPEVMIGQIAARTNTIHVGSGGVMLSHYNSFKVAETFLVFALLFIVAGCGVPSDDEGTVIDSGETGEVWEGPPCDIGVNNHKEYGQCHCDEGFSWCDENTSLDCCESS